MNPSAEAQTQQKLAHTTWGQRLLRRRTAWRVGIVLGLRSGLGLFLLWLGPFARDALGISSIANQPLIALLFGFCLIALSLLWSAGQRLDVWVFASLNLRGYHSRWMDRAMWLTTQIGNAGFAALLAVGAYAWGNWHFADDLGILSSVFDYLTFGVLLLLLHATQDQFRTGWFVESVVPA